MKKYNSGRGRGTGFLAFELSQIRNRSMILQRKLGTAAIVALFVAMLAAPASTQVLNSAARTITLQAVLSQSLTLTLSGNAVNFNLAAGSAANPGSTSITATTSW